MKSTGQSKLVYIINVGRTKEAVISCYWAYIERSKRVPDIIHFIVTNLTLQFLGDLRRAFSIISEKEITFNYTIVNEEDLEGMLTSLKQVIKEYKEKGYEIVVDVTPGRKTMSIALAQVAFEANADEVYYLHLKERKYEGYLYPLIPKPLVKLVRLWKRKP